MILNNSNYCNINLRGNFSEGNFGDDALYVACTRLFAGKNPQFYVDDPISYQDDRLPAPTVSFSKNIALDLIAYGGGTQFFSFAEPSPRLTKSSRFLSLARKLISPSTYLSSFKSRVMNARNRNIPKIAVGIGVGPFSDPVSADATAALLRSMELVWVRDSRSEQFCRINGVENLIVSSDLCFTEAFVQAMPAIPIKTEFAGEKRRIAIILRDWKQSGDDLFERMIEVAKRLRASGHNVQFVSLSLHDHKFISAMSASGEDLVIWDPEKSRLEDFIKHISQKDLIITSRFHGAIFSLLSLIPFVAIEIEPKLSNLREMVPELGRFAVAPSASIDLISSCVTDVLAHQERLRPALERAVSIQRARARTGELALKKFLDSRIDLSTSKTLKRW